MSVKTELVIIMDQQYYHPTALPPHMVVRVIVKDDLFKGDEDFLKLYRAKKKAEKELDEYTNNKRNESKTSE